MVDLEEANNISNINKTSINDFVKMYKYLINGFIKMSLEKND